MSTWGAALSDGTKIPHVGFRMEEIHSRERRPGKRPPIFSAIPFPYEDTFLDLDDNVKDPLGDPVLCITNPTHANEQKAATYAGEKRGSGLAKQARVRLPAAEGGFGGGVSTHAIGGTRMGDDPGRNVVDKFGFSHEAANLGIVGGSVMGTIGARNPTLTFQGSRMAHCPAFDRQLE